MHSVLLIAGTDADQQTLGGFGLKSAREQVLPGAIKIGNLNAASKLTDHINFLKNYHGPVVLDFSVISQTLIAQLPQLELIVFALHEVEIILNEEINSYEAIEKAATKLMIFGAKSVFLKCEQRLNSEWIHDYWTNGSHSFWLTQHRCYTREYPDEGSVFTTSVTAALALGYQLEDALIVAKMYVHQALRLAQGTLYYGGFPENEADLPYLSSTPLHSVPQPFKRAHYLGLYPIVDCYEWVETLVRFGVKTIQLRVKERTKKLEEEIKRSVALAKKHQVVLFINDYWDLALKLNADAVHLGQSDLDKADLEAIRDQGLLLGVSTYCYHEVARAHAVHPSYVAIGPVYPTTSKELSCAAQGIEKLQRWQRTLNYPLVAIGGINLECASKVVDTGVSGIALISAITHAADPQWVTQQLLSLTQSDL